MANKTRMSPHEFASPNTKWLYRFAKQYGPWPKRKHWRLPRVGGWLKWMASDEGIKWHVRVLNEDPELRSQWYAHFRPNSVSLA
jgi:hypothetical protein